jgi:hypothetical protein
MIRVVRVSSEGDKEVTEEQDLTLAKINEIVGGDFEVIKLAHGAVAIQNRQGEEQGLVAWSIRTRTETDWPVDLQMFGTVVLVDRDEAKILLA